MAESSGSKPTTAPTYSICMCNYNMGDTLERSLTSLLDQIDESFEVVVVDDGSTDQSVKVINNLKEIYHNLRLVTLKKDKKRKLGLTRNISVVKARGEYVMLHLDCDDTFGPYLKDFVEVFHKIENCVGRDILLSGRHINMGKRQFLLKHGPYRNLYRGEDRDLWIRLAAMENYIPFNHVNFVTRLPKKRSKRAKKAIVDTWDHMVNDFRTGLTVGGFFRQHRERRWKFNWKVYAFRLVAAIPAFLKSRFDDPLPPGEQVGTPEEFAGYRMRVGGTYLEIMSRHGGNADLSFLRREARKIFANGDY